MTDPNSLEFTVPDPWGDLAAYALNALSADERARVEALIESSPEAREELLRYMEAVENLSALTPDVAPTPEVRRRLLAQVDSDIHLMSVAREDARTFRPERPSWFGKLLKPVRVAYAGTAAALIAVVALTAVFAIENSRLNSEIGQLRDDMRADLVEVAALRESVDDAYARFELQDAEVARLTTVNEALNEALKNMQWLTYVTQNREYRVPEYLEGNSEVPEATGTLAVKNFDDLAVFLVQNLPLAPGGYAYVLSLVRDGTPEAVATFQVNAAGMARVEFEMPGNIVQYESAIVTLEHLDVVGGLPAGPAIMTASETQ